MKLLVLLVACVAICVAHVVPTVPGDNSHYVEGESRYIWMSDDPDTEPVLVDLHEPVDTALLNDPTRNGANNQYWLFTRQNPTSAQIITNGNANSVSNSNYVGSRPLKVIVHGWNSNGNSASNTMVRDALLAVGDVNVIVVDWQGCQIGRFIANWATYKLDCATQNQQISLLAVGDVNVIVVDWRALANASYNTAAGGVPSVGQFLGNFLMWLIGNHGGNWNNVHLIGFSLGAHVVGNAGRTTGNRCRRVTGLDPAGPGWGNNNGGTLRSSDGGYTECIHTDGGLLGINSHIGDASFYPNGGRNPQPGCFLSTCSHSRAYELYASSVLNNRFPGRICSSVNVANSGSCTGSATLNMGNNVLSKTGNGIFHLTTTNNWPF